MATLSDQLGFGLLTPFRRGPADFVAGGGDDHLKSVIGQVLGVRASSDFTEGELPWRPEFGSLLHLLRHRNNDQVTAELARVYVVEALAKWVPQVRVKEVQIDRVAATDPAERNVLLVSLTYDVIGLNRPGNEVLFPSLSTTVILEAM